MRMLPASPAWPRCPGCPRVPGTAARSASAPRAGTGAAFCTLTRCSLRGATSPSASTPAPASTPGEPSSSPAPSSLTAPGTTPSCRARLTSATWVTARAGGARAHQRGPGGARCGRAGAWPGCPGGRGLTLHWVTRGGQVQLVGHRGAGAVRPQPGPGGGHQPRPGQEIRRGHGHLHQAAA